MFQWLQKFKQSSSIDDDFIKRLKSLVIGEGMLHEGNIHLINHAIQSMPANGAVIEIGSYGGLSTNLIAYLLTKYKKDNPFFNCDAWVYEGYHDHKGLITNTIDGRDDVLRTNYSVYMKQAFINATQFLNPQNLPHSFHLYSDVFFEKWAAQEIMVDLFGRSITLGGAISFAYIDGGHSYEIAWRDFMNISQFLLKNGYILLDDSADYMNFGSAKMIADIKKDKRFRIVDKKPNYLIQKIV